MTDKMDRQLASEVAHRHYAIRRDGHVYDVDGTHVFISNCDLWRAGPSSDLRTVLRQRASIQRAKESLGAPGGLAGEGRTAMSVHVDTTSFPADGDNFVKIGQIADEIVRGMAEHMGTLVTEDHLRALAKMEDDRADKISRRTVEHDRRAFPMSALDRRHAHGGLFVGPRGS